MRLVVVGALAVMVSACQTRQATEPIPLSAGVRQLFAKYSAIPTSGYFAVSKDGRAAGYNYCEDWSGCAGISSSGNAIEVCEQYSKGVPCVVYAFAGKPLVDDKTLTVASVQNNQAPTAASKPPPAMPAPPPAAAMTPATPARPATAAMPQAAAPSSTESRSIAVRWEGIAELMAGTVHVEDRGRGGRVSFVFPDKSATCSGTFQAGAERLAGVWSLACSNGETVSGTYRDLGAGQGSVGEGRDAKGRMVQFTVGARG